MRPTWIVLGLVVGLGAVAYVKVKSKADGAALARPTADAVPVAPVAPAPGGVGEAGRAAVAPSSPAGATPAPGGPEAQAADLRTRIARLEAGKDAAGVAALEAELDASLRDTD